MSYSTGLGLDLTAVAKALRTDVAPTTTYTIPKLPRTLITRTGPIPTYLPGTTPYMPVPAPAPTPAPVEPMEMPSPDQASPLKAAIPWVLGLGLLLVVLR